MSSLGKNWNTAAVDKEHAKARSLSCDYSIPKKRPEQEKAREEPAWFAEAMNACWTTGWKRLEVTGAIEEALEENTAKFDHFVDTEKTADAINDFCKKRRSDERGATSVGQKTHKAKER